MDIESVRDYCLSLPHTSEDQAFGPDYLLIRVGGRIFCCISFERHNRITLKCRHDYALELREHHPSIVPAWHWNKKYWNEVALDATLTDSFIRSLIRHSYAEAAKNLPARYRAEHPEINTIESPSATTAVI